MSNQRELNFDCLKDKVRVWLVIKIFQIVNLIHCSCKCKDPMSYPPLWNYFLRIKKFKIFQFSLSNMFIQYFSLSFQMFPLDAPENIRKPLIPLKMSETFWFSVFRGIDREHWEEKGYRDQVKKTLTLLMVNKNNDLLKSDSPSFFRT